MKWTQTKKDAFLGVLLGLGAPAGSLFTRMVFSGSISWGWMRREVWDNMYYYAYMALLTPLAFALFGSYLGRINDNMRSQKKSLEGLMTVLTNESMTDDLTGIYNHRHILVEIEKEVERANRYRRPLCGMMIDVDDFKGINDNYGHLAGDHVLREIAAVLNESVRKIDILGRYGGDEFLVVLPETNATSAKIVAERIQKNMHQHRFQVKNSYVTLTVSIGLTSFENMPKLDSQLFIEKIDEAMFKAKKRGKNSVFDFN